MTTTGFSQRAPATVGERLLGLAGAAINRLAVAWRSAQNRRSVAKLLTWDEHQLRDIGITQGDVQSALATPLSDDPSYRLGAMSMERRAAFRARAEEVHERRIRRNAVRSRQG